jgi:hypothetical protein
MARRRGNPNWGKPEPIGPVIPVVTSFEQAVKEFKLTPDHASGRAEIKTASTYQNHYLKPGVLKSRVRFKLFIINSLQNGRFCGLFVFCP